MIYSANAIGLAATWFPGWLPSGEYGFVLLNDVWE